MHASREVPPERSGGTVQRLAALPYSNFFETGPEASFAAMRSFPILSTDFIPVLQPGSAANMKECIMPNALPLGSSNFATLRANNEIYVDKTELLYRLAQGRGKIFLARPRRFGKSLLISTFESLFRYGLRDFRALAIEKLWNDTTYSVVKLDFSGLKSCPDREGFAAGLYSLLQAAFMPLGFRYQPELKTVFFLDQLKMWLASQAPNSLVLLIDEYDAPLTSHLENPEAFEIIRDCLGEFYAAIKEYEGCFRFFFMTGITKFSNTSIFSAFNNLQDISMNPVFGTLLGYTEEEILRYFSAYLSEAALALAMSEAELLENLKANYDGFSFDSQARYHVFCPWSVLNFLKFPQLGFENYWYTSGGQPSVLLKYLVNHALSEPIAYADTREVRLSELNASRQYDDIGLDVLLTQAGYYTIREVTEDRYAILGYPNQEVAVSMAQLYADRLLQGKRIRTGTTPILSAMRQGDVEAVVAYFNAAVGAIDYHRYPIVDEASCRAYLQVLLIGAAMIPGVEIHNALGRSDMEVAAGQRHWVFEFKYAKKSSETAQLLEQAVEQIRSRRYGEATGVKTLLRVALVFDGEQRCFTAWKCV